MDDVITKDEIETFRTPAEYVSWFDSVLTKFNRVDKYREAIILRKGLFKEIFEELFPLYRLLQALGEDWSDLRLRNIIGSQQYDVEVKDSGCRPFSFIEITDTIMNYDERHRMMYFLEHGSVSLLGQVNVSGTKNTEKTIDVKSEAKESLEILGKTLEKVFEAVQKKTEKDYPDNTALLVQFDDYFGFNFKRDVDRVSKLLLELSGLSESTFSCLFLVGNSGRHIWRKSKGEEVQSIISNDSLRD